MANEIKIAGKFRSTTTEGILADASQIQQEMGQTVEQAIKELDNKATTADSDISNLNANTGIDEYEEFSDQKEYKAGTTVKKDGILYTFKVNHAPGAWDESEVEDGSLKKEINRIDVQKFKFCEIPAEGNLIDANKVIKGYYLNNRGTLDKNEDYCYILVPMRERDITISQGGGSYLGACDMYGNITHVNENNTQTQQTIKYETGDYYAIISINLNILSNFSAEYGDDVPEYSVYGYASKKEFEKVKNTVDAIDADIENVKSLASYSYEFAEALTVGIINKIFAKTSIEEGKTIEINVNGTAEWSRLLLDFNNTSTQKSQRVDNINNGSNLSIVLTQYVDQISVYCDCTKEGDLNINVKILGAFDKYTKEQISGEKIVDNSITINKLSSEIIRQGKNLFNINSEGNAEGHYLMNNGVIADNEKYLLSDYINFNQSMGTICASVNGNKLAGSAYSCLYDKYRNLIKGIQNTESSGIFTWQENVAYIRISFNDYQRGNLQVELGDEITEYEEFGKNTINSDLLPPSSEINAINIALSSLGNNFCVGTSESISDAQKIEFDNFPWHIKKRCIYSLEANVTTLNEIIFGKGYQSYRGTYIRIDNTNIKLCYYDSTESVKETVEHGLTIETIIKIVIYTDNSGYVYVILQTKGGMYKHTFNNWGSEANFALFLMSNGSELTDIKVNAGCQDFSCPVWAFGDSYFGISLNRWPGVIRNLGFYNFLIDGLAGQGSSGAYSDLERALNFGTPKYLLWCLGMNDGDSIFKNNFDKVKKLCENKGITLIASTIPSVPDRNKETINQYVKDSGERYIDFYTAMGANSSGEWYEGYLYTDNVHPTELGAQVLAMQVLMDFPELMQYGLVKTESEIGNITGDK